MGRRYEDDVAGTAEVGKRERSSLAAGGTEQRKGILVEISRRKVSTRQLYGADCRSGSGRKADEKDEAREMKGQGTGAEGELRSSVGVR